MLVVGSGLLPFIEVFLWHVHCEYLILHWNCLFSVLEVSVSAPPWGYVKLIFLATEEYLCITKCNTIVLSSSR